MLNGSTKKIKKILSEYETIYAQKKQAEIREKELKDELESEMKKLKVEKFEESADSGTFFSCVIVKQSRENLDKEKVKEILSDKQYQSCVNISESEFVKITPLKGR